MIEERVFLGLKKLSEDIRDLAEAVKENIQNRGDTNLQDKFNAIATNINTTLQNPEKKTEVSDSANKFTNQITKDVGNISKTIDEFDDLLKNSGGPANQNAEKENVWLGVKEFFEKLGAEIDQFLTTIKKFFDDLGEAIKKDLDKGIGAELKDEKIKPGGFVEKYLNEKSGHSKGEIQK